MLRFLSLLNVERKQALDRQKKREAESPDLPKTKRDGKNLQIVCFLLGFAMNVPAIGWVGGLLDMILGNNDLLNSFF